MASKGKLIPANAMEDRQFRTELENACGNTAQSVEVLKDAHLLEAAISTDNIIISVDNRADKNFRCCAGGVPKIKNVVFINPEKAFKVCSDWLSAGAPTKSAPQKLGEY